MPECGGRSGLVGVRRDDALVLVFLVGFFGGELLGGFDGVFYGMFGCGVVDFDADVVLAAAFFSLVENALDLETDFAVVFLSPVDEFALEVPVGVSHCVDIEVEVNDFVDDYVAGEFIAFFEIDGSDECFEGVAVDGLEDALRHAVVLHQLGESDFLRQFVEVGAAYDFGAHFGEVAFALAGVFLVEEVGHDGTEDSVAKVFEALVVHPVSFPHFD